MSTGESRFPAPPSGWTPPDRLVTRSGEEIDLLGPARASTEAFITECPGYLERYGEPGREWCVHDLQHVLKWALIRSETRFTREFDWLTGILEARAFPLEWLARGTELLADTFERDHPEQASAVGLLRRGAARLRARVV